MKITIGAIFCLCAACAVIITGCTTQGENPENLKTLKVGEMWNIKSLDPSQDGTFITEKAIITETLVGANPDFTLAPNLAKSWVQVNETTWDFSLRDDVLFHNKKPMTADDVKFSLDRVVNMNPRVKSMLKYRSSEVVDPYTVRVHTTELNPIVPGVLHYPDTAIISRDSVDGNGNLIGPIGTGPMKLASFDETTKVLTAVKNPEWWGGFVGFDRLIITPIPDPNTRAMAIENGEVDFTVDVPYSETDRIDSLPGLNVEKYETPRVYKIDCNLNRDTLADKSVRQAISYAINRDEIVEHVLFNVGKPAGGIFLPAMIWANKDLAPYPYNPVKARRLLDEAGWIDTNNDGIREKGVVILKFDLLTYPQRPGLPPMGEAVAAQLKDVGIKVNLKIMENSAITDRIKAGNWDMYLAAYNIAMVPDPEYIITNWYTTGGPDNNAGYSNPELDALVGEARRISDTNERYAKFNRIEAIVYDDLPVIPIAYYGVAIVKKDNLKGFRFDPTAHDYRLDPGMTV